MSLGSKILKDSLLPSYPTSVKCSIDNEKNTAMGGVFFIQFKAVMKIKSARQY